MKHLEDNLTIAVANYIRMQYPKALFCHVPNGGKRNAREGARFKKMGVLAGVSDILIFDTNKTFNGLAIELKIGKNKTTIDQDQFLAGLYNRKWQISICYSFEAAKETIDEYFKRKYV